MQKLILDIENEQWLNSGLSNHHEILSFQKKGQEMKKRSSFEKNPRKSSVPTPLNQKVFSSGDSDENDCLVKQIDKSCVKNDYRKQKKWSPINSTS